MKLAFITIMSIRVDMKWNFEHEWQDNGIIHSYSNLNNPVTYLHLKILALSGIWTQDLPGTKPICYQLSYPGLDRVSLYG